VLQKTEHQQLKKLKILEYPDRRIKPIVLIMIYSGIRVGAFKYLRWKHIIPIKDKRKCCCCRNDSISRRQRRVFYIYYS
jgi:hypothetical protein